jgi:hypothetical protein
MCRIYVLLFLWPLLANADSPCTYCGSWMPTGSLFGAKYKRGVAIAVTATSISLPLCTPISVERIYLSEMVASYSPPPEATLKPVTAVFRGTQLLSCKRPFAGLEQGIAIRVELRPRGSEGWEELVIAAHPLSAVDDLIHGGEILENLPARSGKKQRVRRRPVPTPAAEWWFVRESHDPCDEGTRRGEALCSGWSSNISFQETLRDKAARRP